MSMPACSRFGMQQFTVLGLQRFLILLAVVAMNNAVGLCVQCASIGMSASHSVFQGEP